MTFNGSASEISSIKQNTDLGPLGAVFPLVPGVQTYDWGVPVSQGSLVAQYAIAAGVPLEPLDRHTDIPYAELWMGTHPSLPSHIASPPASSSIALSSYLAQHCGALVGEAFRSRFGAGGNNGITLPFLFKVLSVGKALSIQAHPDKALAERLHRERPTIYKDDNHKPEMAIALTPFRGFCGFRPLHEIGQFLRTVPELRMLVANADRFANELDQACCSNDDSDNAASKAVLRDLFATLMKAAPAQYEPCVSSLASRYRDYLTQPNSTSYHALEVDVPLAQLVVDLEQQYTRDVGVLCAFVLNVVELAPSEALFLGANEPHAYLCGSIIECMAASDNVVRAGLTPKPRDVDVLVNMLSYHSASAANQRMRSLPFLPLSTSRSFAAYKQPDSHFNVNLSVPTVLYQPPIDEFAVLRTRLDSNTVTEETQRPLAGPSLLILTAGHGELAVHPQCLDGQGFDVTPTQVETIHPLSKAGQVFFVAAHTPITLRATAVNDEDEIELDAFRAFVEVHERLACEPNSD